MNGAGERERLCFDAGGGGSDTGAVVVGVLLWLLWVVSFVIN